MLYMHNSRSRLATSLRQYQAEVMFPLLVGGSPGKSKQYLLLAKIFKTLSLTPP